MYSLDLTQITKKLHEVSDRFRDAPSYLSQSVHREIGKIAQEVKEEWVAKLGEEESRVENAASKIHVEQTPTGFSVYSDSPDVVRVEKGRNAHDMKTTHPFGPKSRVNKKGEPYNIIPFRKGLCQKTEKQVPKPIKKVLQKEIQKGWQPSESTGKTYWTPNARGEMVARQRTNWGRRVDLNPQPFRDHTQKYTGLYRIEDKPFAKTADKGIISFRIIKSNQDARKWIIPAKAGKHIARGLAFSASHKVQELKRNINQDIEQLTGEKIEWK
ncbi:MAG: hypothetical protein AAF975_06770 [Spirochaetota bacterium]